MKKKKDNKKFLKNLGKCITSEHEKIFSKMMIGKWTMFVFSIEERDGLMMSAITLIQYSLQEYICELEK